MHHTPQEKPQLNPLGVETFAMKGVAGVLPPKRLRCGAAGIHKLAQKFMPGPITLVLKKKPKVPDLVTAATDEVGVRMPDHPLALKIIQKFGPITSTSANLHSHPDPVNIKNTIKEMGDTVSVYLDCGSTKLGKHSTIIAVHDGEMEVIRQGVIPIKEIEAALHG